MRAPITDKHLLEMMWERFPEIMQRGTERTEQEPVAWMTPDMEQCESITHSDCDCRPLVYGDTTQPQRTWVDLTPEDYNEIWRMDLNNKELMDKTIAKLKEKNDG